MLVGVRNRERQKWEKNKEKILFSFISP